MLIMVELLCGIYARYSSRLQAQGISLEYQFNYCRSVVNDFRGKIIAEFKDKEKSGYHLTVRQRPGMVELMNSIRLGQINCVVFYDESRLSRRILDFYIEFLDPIRSVNPNIKFLKASTGKEWDPDSPEARENLIAALRESANKARYAKASQEIKLSQKKRPNGHYPIGIEGSIKQSLIPNKGIVIVLFIFHLASWGYSERNIADILNKIDFKIEGCEKRDWKHNTVHTILHNPIYIGIGAWNRRKSKTNSTPKNISEVTIYNEYEQVIPKELWDLAHYEIRRKSTNDEEKESNLPLRTDTPFLLSSLIHCHSCNIQLRTKNSTKKGENAKRYTKKGLPLKYYFCPNCKFRVDPDKIHSLLIQQLKIHMKNFISKESIEKIPRNWEKHIKKKIEEEDKNLEKLKFHQLQAENLKNIPEESAKRVQEMVKMELKICSDKISYLHTLKEEIVNLSHENLLQVVYDRFDVILSDDSELVTNVERRYMFLSFIEKITVKVDSQEELQVKVLEYKDLPLPFFYNQISNI